MSEGRARVFRGLHAGPEVLVLPNAWDCASARLLERAGAKAVATASAAIAWSHGVADRQAVPLTALFSHVKRMTTVTAVPLSVDFERGYSDEPSVVAEYVVELARAGVAGVNLEDGAGPPELLVAKLHASREALERARTDIFLNARTDVILRESGDAYEVARRARRYAEAGADGIFVPGQLSLSTIATIGTSLTRPLNIWPHPALPGLDELADMGVRRVTVGPHLALTALSAMLVDATKTLRGIWSVPAEGALGYRDMEGLFD